MQLENTQKKKKEIFHQIVSEILLRTIKIAQCQSVGIRLQKNGDFPFYIHQGYPNFFITKESSLVVKDKNDKIVYDQNGNKLLDCMCGKVINSKFDPSFPFFTNTGSFWTNNTTNLLSNINREQRKFIGSTRNLCNLSGYESVALIPLKTDDKIIGLIHLADPRENIFSKEKISKIENIANKFASIITEAYKIEENLLNIDKILGKSE